MPCGQSFEPLYNYFYLFITVWSWKYEELSFENYKVMLYISTKLVRSFLHGLVEFLNNNLIIKWILILNTLQQRFQSCQLNKGRFLECPPVLKAWSLRGVQGHVALGKISRYVPLTCHFLHFEITVNGNTVPKIIAGSCSDDKRVKMAEKPLKNAKELCWKDWLNKENIIFLWLGRVSKTRRILSENGSLEFIAKNGRFPAKTERLGSLLHLYMPKPNYS